jgi:hypothetical protein
MVEQVSAPEQILVRVSADTYAALQLALPFEGRRSMQDLVSGVIEAYLADLLRRDDGFRQALDGLRESRARADGVLARRRAGAGGRRKLSASP